MTIKEVSTKYNISEDTLRYYEKVGLIPKVARQNGIRNYDANSCGWVSFIKCMRSAGLPIEVLERYVSMYKEGSKTLESRKNILIEERAKLITKKEELDETISKLDYKIAHYEEINQNTKDLIN